MDENEDQNVDEAQAQVPEEGSEQEAGNAYTPVNIRRQDVFESKREKTEREQKEWDEKAKADAEKAAAEKPKLTPPPPPGQPSENYSPTGGQKPTLTPPPPPGQPSENYSPTGGNRSRAVDAMSGRDKAAPDTPTPAINPKKDMVTINKNGREIKAHTIDDDGTHHFDTRKGKEDGGEAAATGPGLNQLGISKAKMAKHAVDAGGRALQGDMEGAKQVVEGVGDRIASRALGEVARDALIASGVGAIVSDLAARLTRWLAEKVMPALRNAGKKILKMYLWILLANSLILFAVIGTGVGMASQAAKGIYGKTATQNASAFDDQDIDNIKLILGSQNSLKDLSSWYFNEADPRWGDKPGQAPFWIINTYASRGCAVSSSAMIAKYYGIENVTPYVFGGYLAKETGSMAMNKDILVKFVNSAGLHKKLVNVPETEEAIAKEIAAGNPILAQGNTAFKASGQHWVVIAGISDDRRYLIINDPMDSKIAGKAGRPSPASELHDGKILGLWALHDS